MKQRVLKDFKGLQAVCERIRGKHLLRFERESFLYVIKPQVWSYYKVMWDVDFDKIVMGMLSALFSVAWRGKYNLYITRVGAGRCCLFKQRFPAIP